MFGAAAERTWPLQWHPHTPSKSKHCHQHLAAVPCSAQAAPAPRSTLQRHRQPRSKASKAHAAINIWHGHPAAALAHSRRHLAATPGRQPAGAPASKLQSTHSRVVGGVVSFQSLSLEYVLARSQLQTIYKTTSQKQHFGPGSRERTDQLNCNN